MNKILLSICAVMMSALSFGQTAQTAKNVVYDCIIGKVNYQEPVKKSTVETIASAVGAGISVATGGESCINKDEPQYAQGVKEAILAGVTDARRIVILYGTPSGEHPVVNLTGNIASIQSVNQMYNQKGIIDGKEHLEEGYRASVIGTVTLTDAQSDAVLGTINLAHQGVQIGWESSVDQAFKQEIAYIQKSVAKQLNLIFPLYANIVEGSTAVKDKQKKVYIDLGEKSGVAKGMQFFVYQVTKVAGKDAKKEIGRIKVTEVMGDEISLCKVIKGGKDIKDAVDTNVELQIMSKD